MERNLPPTLFMGESERWGWGWGCCCYRHQIGTRERVGVRGGLAFVSGWRRETLKGEVCLRRMLLKGWTVRVGEREGGVGHLKEGLLAGFGGNGEGT